MRVQVVYITVAALLGGCASMVPETIRTAAPGNVQITQVRDQPQQYLNATVRWGGKIVSTRNERDRTELEIVGRNLDSEGRPQTDDISQGRFLVNVQGFLDPTIYKPTRNVTVRGRIESFVDRSIEEYRYTYPVVVADTIHLWKSPPLPLARRPYYYEPFYDPWRPWGWPYYRPWP
jgi:outer membrane lipoprotein